MISRTATETKTTSTTAPTLITITKNYNKKYFSSNEGDAPTKRSYSSDTGESGIGWS